MATLISSLFSINSLLLFSSSSLAAWSARHYYLHHHPANQDLQQSNRDLAQVEALQHFIKETDYTLDKVRIGEDEDTGEPVFINTLMTLPRKDACTTFKKQHFNSSASSPTTPLTPVLQPNETEQKFSHNYSSKEQRGTARKLVLCHGWGSSLICYARVMDELSKHYEQIYAVDLLGWGNSSKKDPETIGQSPKEVQDWWVDSLEKWRKAVNLKEGEFDLVGHSFGSFISTSYALKYPSCVNRLILVAPVGLAPWKMSYCEPKTWGQHFVNKIVWDYKATPQKLLKLTGPFSKWAWSSMGKSVNYYGLDEKLWNSFFLMHLSPSSGDVAFLKLMTRNGWELPLRDSILQDLQCPLRIMYGMDDWVDQEIGEELVRNRRHPEHATEAIYIPSVGHHVYFEMERADFVNWIVSPFSSRNRIVKINAEADMADTSKHDISFHS